MDESEARASRIAAEILPFMVILVWSDVRRDNIGMPGA
jgi:hypothetical protein